MRSFGTKSLLLPLLVPSSKFRSRSKKQLPDGGGPSSLFRSSLLLFSLQEAPPRGATWEREMAELESEIYDVPLSQFIPLFLFPHFDLSLTLSGSSPLQLSRHRFYLCAWLGTVFAFQRSIIWQPVSTFGIHPFLPPALHSLKRIGSPRAVAVATTTISSTPSPVANSPSLPVTPSPAANVTRGRYISRSATIGSRGTSQASSPNSPPEPTVPVSGQPSSSSSPPATRSSASPSITVSEDKGEKFDSNAENAIPLPLPETPAIRKVPFLPVSPFSLVCRLHLFPSLRVASLLLVVVPVSKELQEKLLSHLPLST